MTATRTDVWARFVRDGWTVKGAAEAMGVSEDYAAAEMARVRRRVQNAIISSAVARDLRSRWNPVAAVHLGAGGSQR